MNPEYILKLATTKPKKQQEPVQKRYANPLAILKANQVGLSQIELQQGSMLDNLAKITNNLKEGKIQTTTKQAKSSIPFDPTGMASMFANWHRIFPITDIKTKLAKIVNSDYVQGHGYRGCCDAIAALRAAPDPNVIKGDGQEVLSFNKNKDITSKNMSQGRHERA